MANETDEKEQGVGAEGVRGRVVELEALIAQKSEALSIAEASLSEIGRVKGELEARLVEAVSSYKTMVIQTNPEVEELISGDTIEAINESLKKAKALAGKVRQGLETQALKSRVPAGAPERASPDISSLSAREKIQYALGGRK